MKNNGNNFTYNNGQVNTKVEKPEYDLIILKEEIKKAINDEARVFGADNNSNSNKLNNVDLREFAKSKFDKNINQLNNDEITEMADKLYDEHFKRNK